MSREGCIEDAKKIIQLFNTLPSIDFSSCGIYPFDVPKDAIDIVNTALLCKYSCKPFLQDIDSLDSGKLILEMLRLLKDSRQENIREMVYILPASLHYKKVGLQLAELWGQEQYPIWIKSSFIEENSSFYATLCQVVCEWLSGIAYLASLETNSKVVLHWDSSLVYKEHLVFCSPGQIQIAFALQEIAECLGFSCFTNLSPNLTWWDFQTGWEKGCISSVNWIRENPFMSYVGILGEDFSPEQLVLDNFIANIFKKWNEKNQETAQGISLEQLCELARQRYVPDEKKWEAKEMSLLLGEMFYKEKEEILRTIHRSVQNIFDAPKYSSLLEEDREKEVERLVQIRYEQLGV